MSRASPQVPSTLSDPSHLCPSSKPLRQINPKHDKAPSSTTGFRSILFFFNFFNFSRLPRVNSRGPARPVPSTCLAISRLTDRGTVHIFQSHRSMSADTEESKGCPGLISFSHLEGHWVGGDKGALSARPWARLRTSVRFLYVVLALSRARTPPRACHPPWSDDHDAGSRTIEYLDHLLVG